MERWSYMIEGAEDKREAVLNKLTKKVEAVEAPYVSFQRRQVAPAAFEVGTFKKAKREFLVASNACTKDYNIYIDAKAYGKQLQVSWYLVARPGIFDRIILWMKTHWIIGTILLFPWFLAFSLLQQIFHKEVAPDFLNVFDMEEMTAYVTTVHHAALESVGEVMTSLNQDASKINKESRGFLRIT